MRMRYAYYEFPLAPSAGIIYPKLSGRCQGSIPTFSLSLPVLGYVCPWMSMFPHHSQHIFLVMHWHAVLDDRDEDVLVHPSDQLYLRRDRKEDLQGQCVSRRPYYRIAHPNV